jgi:hypothetical protein
MNYNDLDIDTRYTFAEFEIKKAIPLLHQATQIRNVTQTAENLVQLLKVGDPTCDMHQVQEFAQSYTHHRFGELSKMQQGEYFRFQNVPYRVIREITGLSPNTIAKVRFDSFPYYIPFYRYWTPEMLDRWNTLAKTINIFGEPLAHSQKEFTPDGE